MSEKQKEPTLKRTGSNSVQAGTPQEFNKEFWRKLAIKTVVFSVVMVLFFVLIKILFEDQIANIGAKLYSQFGYMGMVLYVFFVDMFILPASMDIVFAFLEEVNPWKMSFILGGASIAGGCIGYWIARSFNRLAVVERVSRAFRQQGEGLLNRYGGWAVCLAAITPLPFSSIMWVAGILKVPFYEVFLGSLIRVPRVLLYYHLIQGSLSIFQ